MTRIWQAICLFLCVILLSGCRESAQPTPTPDPNLQIGLETPATAYKVGADVLIVTLKDAADQPIRGAVVEIVGDMNHAGMVPVNGKVESDTDGRYPVPFQWSMGGDWILTITATLPDGRRGIQQFNVSVAAQ